MRLLVAFGAVLAVFGAALPATAGAAVETLTFQTSPIRIAPYFTAEGQARAPSPSVDGYIVGMSAEIVDADGNPLTYRDVMLHHVVFANLFHPDATCSTFKDYSGQVFPF